MPIEVTQEDRNRAAIYANGPEAAEKVLAGLLDDHPIVRDFASHRIAAFAEGEAAGIMLRDDYYKKVRERNAKGGVS